MAAVSRLISRVFEDRWGSHAEHVTLLDPEHARRSLVSSSAMRVRFGIRLAARQMTGRCDGVFYTHLSVARVQAFVPAPVRRPYAIFIHGIEAWRPLTNAQTSVLKGAALRVANSSFTARRVLALHPAIGSVLECPLALTDPPGSPPPASISPGLGPHVVLLVARMSASERYKGHDELLEAWPMVLAQRPDARLVFAGDGDDAGRLKEKAAALGVGSTVVFTGFVSQAELLGLYRDAAVFAMPSRGEGFGLVYLEAMSHRLPCIGASDDAASEIIEDGLTGFLVEQRNRDALASRLVTLLTDPVLRAAMGERGFGRLRDHFSYERFAKRILSLVDAAFPVSAAEGLAAPRPAR